MSHGKTLNQQTKSLKSKMKRTLVTLVAAGSLLLPSSLGALIQIDSLSGYGCIKVPPTREIQVKKGETLWEISKREYGTPWAYGALAITNGIRNPKRIYPEQTLVIYQSETEICD